MYRQAVASGKLTGQALMFATEFGKHEAAHVVALTSTIKALGGTPVAPRASYKFPAFDTQANILSFLSGIEDVGVGAYLGQVSSVTSPDVLGAAAGIYAVEALHTAAFRTLMGRDANPNGGMEKPLTAETVLQAAGPLLGPEATMAPAFPAPLRPGQPGFVVENRPDR